MNIDLGAHIVSSDDHRIGSVDGLVMDPRSGEVRSIILRKGILWHVDQIIPIEAVASVDEAGVHVNFTHADADAMNEYMDADYLTPPAGYYGTSGVFWPPSRVYAEGYMNKEESLMIEDQIELSEPGAVIINEGTLVVDRNGDHLGRITEIVSDERGHVAAFKVEQGLFRHHERYVPAHFIETADEQVVKLTTTKDAIEEIVAGSK